MLYNATILRIDTISGMTPGGDPAYSNGAAAALRCNQNDPNFMQRQTIASLSLDATDVVFVETSLLPEIVAGTRIVVQLDGFTTQIAYIVRRAKPSVMAGALGHWELLVKVA